MKVVELVVRGSKKMLGKVGPVQEHDRTLAMKHSLTILAVRSSMFVHVPGQRKDSNINTKYGGSHSPKCT